MGGGPAVRTLERIRRDYPLVDPRRRALARDAPDGLDEAHLDRLAALVQRLEPALVSEHLSWSVAGDVYLNHLLPLPCTDEALAVVAGHVARVQDRLGRPLLVENPASYLRFRDAEMTEPQFLEALARTTGCGVLCDVNNVFVSCTQPRRRRRRLPRGARCHHRRGDPPRRSRRQRGRRADGLDRRSRLARGAGRVAAVHARHRALRRGADARGVGHRRPAPGRPPG